MRAVGIGNRSLQTIIRETTEGHRIVREQRLGSALTVLQKHISKVNQFRRRTRGLAD